MNLSGHRARITALTSALLALAGVLAAPAAHAAVTNMQMLLDWLSTQVGTGAVAMETTGQVIGGPFVTPFCC